MKPQNTRIKYKLTNIVACLSFCVSYQKSLLFCVTFLPGCTGLFDVLSMSSGEKGDAGFIGDPGPSGLPGTNGNPGLKGNKGAQGDGGQGL